MGLLRFRSTIVYLFFFVGKLTKKPPIEGHKVDTASVALDSVYPYGGFVSHVLNNEFR